MYKKQFGSTIKRLRKGKDLSQEELGKLLHTTKQNISSWERNRTQPNNEDIEKMAKIFGCSFDDIIREEEFQNFVNNMSDEEFNTITLYYKHKETEIVANAYFEAPDSIKEAVCKLLDINRKQFNISRYLED